MPGRRQAPRERGRGTELPTGRPWLGRMLYAIRDSILQAARGGSDGRVPRAANGWIRDGSSREEEVGNERDEMARDSSAHVLPADACRSRRLHTLVHQRRGTSHGLAAQTPHALILQALTCFGQHLSTARSFSTEVVSHARGVWRPRASLAPSPRPCLGCGMRQHRRIPVRMILQRPISNTPGSFGKHTRSLARQVTVVV